MKNCFVIVHSTTGALLLNGATLPVYYKKWVAKRVAERYAGYVVKTIDIHELKSLIGGGKQC
jgi:hypothetical protein